MGILYKSLPSGAAPSVLYIGIFFVNEFYNVFNNTLHFNFHTHIYNDAVIVRICDEIIADFIKSS